MRLALPGLLCALMFSPLAYGQQANSRQTAESRAAGREITVSVLIADLTQPLENPTASKILEMEASGKLRAATRVQLVLLDELPAAMNLGTRAVPRTVNIGDRGGFGDRGGPVGVTVQRPQPTTGVQLRVTTRIEDGGQILAEIYLERPDTAIPEALLPSDASNDQRQNFAVSLQSTVRLKSGEAKLVSSRQSGVGAAQSSTLIVVTATAKAD